MKNSTTDPDKKIANITFSSVYPLYLTKIEKKGRTKDELLKVIEWLTGFDETVVHKLIEEKITFEVFFSRAKIHPNANLIKGVICGIRVEEIQNPVTQQIRYLDKLVDELAKGKIMDKILR